MLQAWKTKAELRWHLQARGGTGGSVKNSGARGKEDLGGAKGVEGSSAAKALEVCGGDRG